jgi:hypothetical protein
LEQPSLAVRAGIEMEVDSWCSLFIEGKQHW